VTTHATAPATGNPTQKSGSRFWKFSAVLGVSVAVGSAFYLQLITPEGVKSAFAQITTVEKKAGEGSAKTAKYTSTDDDKPKGSWNGLVAVTSDEEVAIGFNHVKALEQKDPIRLELTGRTAYDPNTVSRIRPRFDTRVETVFANLGQEIHKGDPLVELYSVDLATAKSDFQVKYVQWQHDVRLLTLREQLIKTGAISNQLFVDTQNDEQKSRLDFNLARDKLALLYEVPKDEIDPLLVGLQDKLIGQEKFGSLTHKAKMTIRSKTDGVVIDRNVVVGSYYESTDVLMEVAPIDHLHVLLNVYELDQDKVKVGMNLMIHFPFLEKDITGKVEYVASQVSKDNRAVKVRASVNNPGGRLKSDMLVTASLEIPPRVGQTVIPRLAMVALNGNDYVFVRDTGAEGSKDPKTKEYRRVKVQVAQENADNVVIASGLKGGDDVVTNGSLILSQLYEDRAMTVTGVPAR